MFKKNILFISPKFKQMIIKKKKSHLIHCYTNSYDVKITLSNKVDFFIDSVNNVIKLFYKFPNNLTKSVNFFKSIIFSINDYFFKKIKYKGKGFRLKIKKKKKAIKFLFGHSHLYYAFLKNIKIKKCGKYKFILKSVNPYFLKKINKEICNVKPINIYTNRGIRSSRQIIKKRKGKKGSYT